MDNTVNDAISMDCVSYGEAAAITGHSGGSGFRSWMHRFNRQHPDKPIRRPKPGHVCQADVYRATISLACGERDK